MGKRKNEQVVLEEKNIRCYACKNNKGVARKMSFNGKTAWKASGFKRIGMRSWLCEQCNSNRCKRCDILLNTKIIRKYGIHHGVTYKIDSKYCKICFDIRKKGRNQNINN